MIGFNGTYLDKANLGNMRITTAALGGQWVIGDKWLKTATRQAIIAAFGAEEGNAVINKTNDYLNAIALTDQTKAQALAGYVNQYPLYAACVGGLYPAVDYIESDHVHNGVSYLIIDYYLNNDSAIDVIFSGKTMNNNRDMLFGANNASGNCESYSISGTRWMIREGGSEKYWDASIVIGNNKVQMTQDPNDPSNVTLKYIDAGTEITKTMSRGNIAATSKLHLFTIARSTTTAWNDGMRIYQFNIHERSDIVIGLVPCYKSSNGEIGLYDFINGKFYQNAGTGHFTKGEDLYPSHNQRIITDK